ncbi:MAG TPA: TIM barrel protein [Acidimicrobiales bacterium]|nr:TIM barrel protein [Acidimicrobiales bacterium]
MRRAIGVVHVVFAPDPPTVAAQRAAALGFDHIDVPASVTDALALPVADRIAPGSPKAGCSSPAPTRPPRADDLDALWDRAVAAYRRTPGVRLEPWGGSICDSIDRVKAMLDAVPGLRLLVDTGHVAGWGEDPSELLPHAAHVQLRQARLGEVQRHPDDGGDVDFGEILRRLDALDYRGALSVEYFDLPDYGWPLVDPIGHAVALAAHVRALF